jgi:hypothetical protein
MQLHKTILLNRDIVVGILAVCLGIYLLYATWPYHGIVKYDCTWAEISPDVPVNIKEECRKLRRKL